MLIFDLIVILFFTTAQLMVLSESKNESCFKVNNKFHKNMY